MGGKLANLNQVGFSRKTSNGFRFPIQAICIGTEEGLKKHPVGIVAGVHGLETIGVLILFDFLEYILHPNFTGYLPELKKGKLGIVILPIVNPGGVALKQRSNPAGVDLMRNSGVNADKALPFFGGQKISNRLPYFRGQGLEPESKALFRLIYDSFFDVENAFVPVLDLHSGFGTIDNVWWPYAYTKSPCPDTSLYKKSENISNIAAVIFIFNMVLRAKRIPHTGIYGISFTIIMGNIIGKIPNEILNYYLLLWKSGPGPISKRIR